MIPTINTSTDKSIPKNAMISGSNIGIYGGTFTQSRTSRGMDILIEWVAAGAFYNSDELYDAPKCHPQTRVAVLDDIMKWVGESESARDDFMLWFFGSAGAGKSAIAKRIAEMAAERGLLLAVFFFSRTSPTRNTKDRLIATLAYQLTISIPNTRSYIEDAIERDPAIFHKNILTQIDTLLIKPFQSVSSSHTIPSQNLIIIDDLDECNNNQAQVAILDAISRSFTQHSLPIKFLVVSRPEPDLVTSFNCNEPLRSIHRRLALDDTYRPDDDIRRFFSDKFKHIKHTHLLRSTIPITWPTHELLHTLVKKSSGQFIYASTVVKFVESSCHQPTTRLNIILGILPPGRTNPFAELDALYNHLLSSVDDIQLTLRVLSLYVVTPDFTIRLQSLHNTNSALDTMPALFLSLQPGDIQRALTNLSSIITYNESSGAVKVLHASLVDFLSDKRRSNTFYIDMGNTCVGFVRRVLQHVKGPDGILAGNMYLLRGVVHLSPYIPKGQLWSEILNYDLDALINASIRWLYKDDPSLISGSTIIAYDMWKDFLHYVRLVDEENKDALNRLNKSFESRLRIYQSDWRLQLLLTLAIADVISSHGRQYHVYEVPPCRCLDILLEMDNHGVHLVDQHALDLRHTHLTPSTFNIIPRIDDDAYASAALHCMRFLSNPPQYSEKIEHFQMGLIYAEWKATCAMTLTMLCKLLQRATTLPELVQFISNHDIHLTIQTCFPADRVLEVNAHILAFLTRASVCPNWRITSTIQRSLLITHQTPSNYARSGEDEDWRSCDENEGEWETWYLIRQRLDQYCSIVH